MHAKRQSQWAGPTAGRGPWALLAAVVLVCAGAARGLINPDFTPADLVRGAKLVVVLRVSSPDKQQMRAQVVETLKGDPPPGGQIILDLANAEDLDPAEVDAAFAGAKTVEAVLVARKDARTGKLVGGVRIGSAWFGVRQGAAKGTWNVDRDAEELELVWAGSARMLARGARYVLADPAAAFPVASTLRWGSDQQLGQLPGPVHGCVVTDLGGRTGLCAVVLSDGGDRVYQAAEAGGRPADITAALKLATASRLMTPGDFNSDGRIDLASWDGRLLRLAVQEVDGTFSQAAGGAELGDCASLAAIEAGPAGRQGVLAGTGRGPLLCAPDAAGAWTVRALAPAGRPGPAGPCAVADLDRDGRCDVLAVGAKGVALFAGAAEPGHFAPPVATDLDLPARPRQAVCGDYDADGWLDVLVVGSGGLAMLTRADGSRWVDAAGETGELIRHGGAGQAPHAAAACDINADGRQGVVLFYPTDNPAVFFNRGFACFGLARKLVLAESKLAGAAALGRGQAAGAMLDLNGDAAQDLLAVAPAGAAWVLLGQTDEPTRLALTVSLPPRAAGPVTLAVLTRGRTEGMYVLRPGVPAVITRPRPGPVDLAWTGRDGKPHTRRVVLLKPTRLTLADAQPDTAR